MDNKTALITGASSGIGYELAKIFAENKYNLVLVARREELLLQLGEELKSKHGITAKVIAKDLTQQSVPEDIYNELKSESINIDILVNNAGIGSNGFFWENDRDKELDTIKLNIFSLTHLTHLFLKDMVSRKNGRILNVASTAAFQAGPLMAVYYASKAYVLSFSEALASELKGKGITVSTLCPGPTITGFQDAAKMHDVRMLNMGMNTDVVEVAKAGYRGLMKGKTIIIPGAMNKFGVLSAKFSPRSMASAIARKLNERT